MHNVDKDIICFICNSKKFSPDITASSILGLKYPYQVWRCLGCRILQLLPKLDGQEQKQLYSREYFNSDNVNTPVFKDLSLNEDYSKVVSCRISKYHKSISIMLNLFSNRHTFLDVGAATGEMVMLARKAGFNAEGVELSDFAVHKAREKWGIVLKQIPLSEVESESFEIVHLNHVFEHFNDPIAELKNIYRILTPGGGIYIEIPYQFHIIDRIKYFLVPRSVPFSLHSIHHPFFYSPKTIHRLLRDNGFKILKMNVFGADRYPASTPIQKIKHLFWRVASWLKIGNYIEIYAVKTDGSIG